MKVVVGKAYGHQTPAFAAEMTYLIFHPYWDVPSSIARRELIPKFARDPEFLRENHYEIVGLDGEVVTRNNASASILDAVRAGRYRVRQMPGPDNALGGVKFMFPNEHNVYLHGTPAMELFSKTRRDFSHGCIRVEKPAELAQWVLRNRPDWPPERIRAAINGKGPLKVVLDQPIPVLIVYGTAVVEETGDVRFFHDIYGKDAALERALAAAEP